MGATRRLETHRRRQSIVAALTTVAFGLLFAVVIPGRHEVNGQIFGIGLAITAYLLGVRHAFDADHIAAIDNTTRKLVADGTRPVTIGLFFSLGHSTVVFVMALFVAIGAKFVATLVADDSTTHQTLGIIGTSVSGIFLITIGLINLIALLGIYQVWREAQTSGYDEAALEHALNNRGIFARLLRPAMKAIKDLARCTHWASCSASASTPPPKSPCSSSPAPAPPPACPGTPSSSSPCSSPPA